MAAYRHAQHQHPTATAGNAPASFTMPPIDVDGLTYDEAAAALGIPVGTVMSRLHRARHRMRAHLAHIQTSGANLMTPHAMPAELLQRLQALAADLASGDTPT